VAKLTLEGAMGASPESLALSTSLESDPRPAVVGREFSAPPLENS
jgi:hypothetical protein